MEKEFLEFYNTLSKLDIKVCIDNNVRQLLNYPEGFIFSTMDNIGMEVIIVGHGIKNEASIFYLNGQDIVGIIPENISAFTLLNISGKKGGKIICNVSDIKTCQNYRAYMATDFANLEKIYFNLTREENGAVKYKDWIKRFTPWNLHLYKEG